jgi:hypothetical protein
MPGLDAMLATGATARQLDHWTTRGYLRAREANPGSGHDREWLAGEDDVAARMLRLTVAGLRLDVAAELARYDGPCPVCRQPAEVG